MPEIEINGEKKKVACGPCIRGHRSSKCTHKDRVLIEVRKPGRPLSACPHPSGSCTCERMVVNYTLPKTSHCSCTASPAASSGTATGRVQKGKAKKPNSNLTPTTLQRAFSADDITVNEQTKTPGSILTSTNPRQSCCGTTSDADNAIQGSPIATDHGGSPAVVSQTNTNGGTNATPPLRLGMLGVGGYGTIDRIGWSQPYPDMSNVQYEQKGVSRHLAASHDTSPLSTDDANESRSSCCNARPSETSLNSSLSTEPIHITQETSQRPPSDLTVSHSSPAQAMQADARTVVHEQGDPHPQHNGVGQSMNAHHQQPVSVEPPEVLPMIEPAYADPDHICSCGEGCACLACLTHPYNKTTLDYVRYHTDFSMKHGGGAVISNDQSRVNDVNGVQAPRQTNWDQVPIGDANNALMPWLMDYGDESLAAVPRRSWHSSLQTQATPTQELEHLHLKAHPTASDTTHSALNGYATRHSDKHHPTQVPSTPKFEVDGLENNTIFKQSSPHQSEETPTLSPSAFFLQSYTIPACDDATGTCQCGDGCTCPGCLTHSGHQVLQQSMPMSNLYEAHGLGCACPHPELTRTPNSGSTDTHSTPLSHEADTSLDEHVMMPVASPAAAHGLNGMPASMFTHVHGPNCACPVDNAVLQAQAKVQAHAQLHGPLCRCPTGVVFLNAQLQAEARLHNQLHGDAPHGWLGEAPG